MDPESNEQDEITPPPRTDWIQPGASGAIRPEGKPVALPFEAQDLGLALLSPARVVEILLTDWPRLARSVAERRFLVRLGLILFFTTVFLFRLFSTVGRLSRR